MMEHVNKTSEEEEPENDFLTYLCNSTQFLDYVDEYVSNNSQNLTLKPLVIDISEIVDDASLKQSTSREHKRKRSDEAGKSNKVLKTTDKTIESAFKTDNHIQNDTVDFRMTQLFKTPQYQTEVASVFKELQLNEYDPLFGLPIKVVELIEYHKGITTLYDWQKECLNLPAVKNHSNVVCALPSRSGKTLVAEILMLREVICRKKNVLFILPHDTIVQEKIWALSPFAVALDFLIEEYAVGKGTYPPKKRRHKNSIYIATIDKAPRLIDSLIEKERLDEIGLTVVDHLNILGDSELGPILETCLTKIMYMIEITQIVSEDIQIFGMSAIIGNLSDICSFLKADLFQRSFRPMQLNEYIKVGNTISRIHREKPENVKFLVERKEDFSHSDVLNIDPDRLGGLVMEVVPHDSCLIFCSTKKDCKNVSRALCKVLLPTLRQYKKKEKEDLITALKNEGNNNIGTIFNVSIKLGIAYLHSGLLSEERKLLEDAFREGVISVICCTSALAGVVNLSAKRVILRKPYIGREFINLSHYTKLVSHAGRVGFREECESILILKNNHVRRVRELLQSPVNEIFSNLHASEENGLRHLLLSCVKLGIATNGRQLEYVANKTLLAVQKDKLKININNLTGTAIHRLLKLDALRIYARTRTSSVSSSLDSSLEEKVLTPKNGPKNEVLVNSKLTVSKLGKTAIKACLELSQARLLYRDLIKAQKRIVRLNHLHLLYLVTTSKQCKQIKPPTSLYCNLLTALGKSEKQTAEVLGITESCIKNLSSTNGQIQVVPENVLLRFYVSLMLYDLWNGMPIFDVADKYQISRGVIQRLMVSSATLASNVLSFCEEIEKFWPFKYSFKSLSERLSHCSERELLPLMELPTVKQSQAKQLYNAGYKTLQLIAKSDPNELAKNIQFNSKKVSDELIAAAKMFLLEKVETLRDEAENILNGDEQMLEL